MQKIIIIILISFFSCKKDKAEYVNHESEILSGHDTLIYGNWEYLYTWGSSGGLYKINNGIPSINIKPIDNYEIYRDGEILEKGKIDTLGHSNDYLLLIFYPNAIVDPNRFLKYLSTCQIDTLIIGTRFGKYDALSRDYYKRIKQNN